MSDNASIDNLAKGESVLKWFLEFTSIGGLSQAHSTNLRLSKLVWTLIFVLGAALTFWNFVGVLEDYWDNKVKTVQVY